MFAIAALICIVLALFGVRSPVDLEWLAVGFIAAELALWWWPPRWGRRRRP